MAWHQTGDKQLPKPLLIHVADMYASPGLCVLE